jgi:hypothetical protein
MVVASLEGSIRRGENKVPLKDVVRVGVRCDVVDGGLAEGYVLALQAARAPGEGMREEGGAGLVRQQRESVMISKTSGLGAGRWRGGDCDESAGCTYMSEGFGMGGGEEERVGVLQGCRDIVISFTLTRPRPTSERGDDLRGSQ